MGRLFGDDKGAPFRLRFIGVGDGLRLAVRDYGETRNPAILCLAGLTRNAKDFHPLASALHERYRIISFDYRGRGRSDWDPNWRHYVPGVYLGDVAHVLTALNVGRCAVIGTSLGGLLGFAMGIAMPTRIKGLMVNDIGPAISTAAIAPIRDFMSAGHAFNRLDEAVSYLMTVFPDLPAEDESDWRVIAGATFRDRGEGVLKPDWDPAIRRMLERPPPSKTELWPLFDSLARYPLGLVHGEKSRFLEKPQIELMLARRPDIITADIAGVGHAPSLMEPAAQTAIARWLERCFEN